MFNCYNKVTWACIDMQRIYINWFIATIYFYFQFVYSVNELTQIELYTELNKRISNFNFSRDLEFRLICILTISGLWAANASVTRKKLVYHTAKLSVKNPWKEKSDAGPYVLHTRHLLSLWVIFLSTNFSVFNICHLMWRTFYWVHFSFLNVLRFA